MGLRAVNPATGKVIESFTELDSTQIGARLSVAAKAFEEWRVLDFYKRAESMHSVAHLLRKNKRVYGTIMALEMGKPITEGMAESEKCAWACEYYAEKAKSFLAEEEVETDAKRSFVRYEPLGPILGVMPWNFPFWQVFRFIAPSLMAGNIGLLKHASNVPRSATTIQEIMENAGFPKGVFQSLLVGSSKVERIVRDSRIKAVTITGSEKAGAAVAAMAGEEVKKTVMELGGSDPFLVLKDANLERAAKVAAQARCINSGQSCIAAKRFIVEKAVHPEFLGLFKEEMQKLRVGDPLKDDTQIGPIARKDLREELARQVRESVARGARVELGGRPLDGPGYFFSPTILSNVKPGMPVYDEEVFGPVAGVIKATDDKDAVHIANDNRYGLGASVWTDDLDKAIRLVGHIEAGMVFVNGLVKSDPRLPFGGVKASGYGRELGSYGIREFVNIKTVWVEGRGALNVPRRARQEDKRLPFGEMKPAWDH